MMRRIEAAGLWMVTLMLVVALSTPVWGWGKNKFELEVAKGDRRTSNWSGRCSGEATI